MILSVLDVRRRRPEPFAGAYTPIPAGDDVCAFLRGDDVLVAVAVRDLWRPERWSLPPGIDGTWRDVVTGAEFELPTHASAAGVLGPEGRALLERVD
jgi:(1->4)-alpha-D-glucan 1-alpha-D-glucosylmutase